MFLCFVLDSLIYSPCLRNSLKSEDKIDDKSIARSSVILLRLQITEKEKKKSFFVGYEIEMSLLGYDLKITNFLHFLRNKKGTR